MSAPATNALGFARLPSSGSSGWAPVTIMHRTRTSDSAQATMSLIADVTSAFNAFNLLGRLMVTNATTVPSPQASTGMSSIGSIGFGGGLI